MIFNFIYSFISKAENMVKFLKLSVKSGILNIRKVLRPK